MEATEDLIPAASIGAGHQRAIWRPDVHRQPHGAGIGVGRVMNWRNTACEIEAACIESDSAVKNDLLSAIEAALAGDWDRAHRTVQQDETDPLACWIHAVLHKIEGDAGNSRYWYARSAHSYGEFADPRQELVAIRREVEARR